MSDFDRVIGAIRAVKKRYPSMRIGQMIANVLPARLDGDPFYIPDADLAVALEALLGRIDAD